MPESRSSIRSTLDGPMRFSPADSRRASDALMLPAGVSALCPSESICSAESLALRVNPVTLLSLTRRP